MKPSELSAAAIILRSVCRHFEVSLAQLECPSRSFQFVWPRHCAMVLIRERVKLPLAQIGLLFRRDHGTVMCAIRRHAAIIETDPKLRSEWEELKKEIKS